MNENQCDCCIGYTLSPRDEFFRIYYLSDIELGNVKVEDIDTKYNYCPDCGIKIEL